MNKQLLEADARLGGRDSGHSVGNSADHGAGMAAARPESKAAVSARPLEERLGAVTLAVLLLITLANVVVRYLTSQSFAWTEEISVFLLLVMTLAGSACAATADSHIRIEFFYSRGSIGRRRALLLLSALATAAIFVLLAVLMAHAALDEFDLGETTMGIGVPRWWYTVWLPGLALLVGIRAVAGGVRRAHALDAQAGDVSGDAS